MLYKILTFLIICGFSVYGKEDKNHRVLLGGGAKNLAAFGLEYHYPISLESDLVSAFGFFLDGFHLGAGYQKRFETIGNLSPYFGGGLSYITGFSRMDYWTINGKKADFQVGNSINFHFRTGLLWKFYNQFGLLWGIGYRQSFLENYTLYTAENEIKAREFLNALTSSGLILNAMLYYEF